MQPFYQGKIDTFCAVYAVLNALQILHDITAGKARELFNEVLVDQSRNEARFRAVLTHRTDYVDLVDRMLTMVRPQFPFREGKRFAPGSPRQKVWDALTEFAVPELRRTAVFRFRRYTPGRASPVVDHWTTALNMDGGILRFFDSSMEPGGVYSLEASLLADAPAERGREYFIIAPESVRLLARG